MKAVYINTNINNINPFLRDLDEQKKKWKNFY